MRGVAFGCGGPAAASIGLHQGRDIGINELREVQPPALVV
jgi:hypothetical protein